MARLVIYIGGYGRSELIITPFEKIHVVKDLGNALALS